LVTSRTSPGQYPRSLTNRRTSNGSRDFAALIPILDPDVVFHVDTGGRASLTPALLIGAVDVAEHAATHGPRLPRSAARHWSTAAGIVARGPRGNAVAVVGMTVIGERIAEIDLILDPAKIASVND
jgi:hypothetical protein